METSDIIYYAFVATCVYVATRATLSIIRMALWNMLTSIENKLHKKVNRDAEAKAAEWCKNNPIEVDNREKKLGLNLYEPAFRHSSQFVGVQMDLFPLGNHTGPVGMG